MNKKGCNRGHVPRYRAGPLKPFFELDKIDEEEL